MFRGVHGLESGTDEDMSRGDPWQRIGPLASTCPARDQSHALQRSQVKCF